MRYVLSYDLNNNPTRTDYESLWKRLRELGFERILYSQWITRWNNTTAENIVRTFMPHIDSNDRLMVMCMDSSDWSAYRPMVDPNTL